MIKYLAILSFLLFIEHLKGCDDNCLKCEDKNPLKQQVCLQCINGNVYDEINQSCMKKEQCENYQYHQYSNNNDSQFNCVSICKQNTISLSSDNSCSETYQCSVQNIQPSNISQGRQITDVYLLSNNNLLLIYNNFINLISAMNGQFIRQFNFVINIILIKRFQEIMYLLSIDKKLYSWSIGQSDPKLEISISTGAINSKTEIITAINNESRIFVVSFKDYQKQVILSEINAKQKNEVVIGYSNTVYIQSNMIVDQSLQNQVIIKYIEENQEGIVKEKSVTLNICSDIQGQFNQMLKFTQNSLYFYTFVNSKGVIVFSSLDQSCKTFSNDLIPIQIDLYYFKNDQNKSQNAIILASFKEKTFKIFYGINQKILNQITLDQEIVDFSAALINDELTKIYILKANHIIDVFTLKNINQIQQESQFNLIKSINILITNPLVTTPFRLLTLNIKSDSNNEQCLCIFNQDVQILKIQDDETSGIIVDFKEKSYEHTTQINSIFLSDPLNLLLSCADDGKIVIWNNFDLFNIVYYDSISIKDQKCIQVMLFQQLTIVAQFSNSILLQNIYNKSLSKIYAISQTLSFINIYTSSNYIYLVFDKQIKILIGFDQVFNYQINKDLQKAFITNLEELYLLDNSNILSAYKIDFQNKVIVPKVSPNPYQFTQPVQYIKMFEIKDQDNIFMISLTTNAFFYVLDINLNPLIPQLVLEGSLLQIYQFDYSKYVFLLNAPNKNSGFPSVLQFFDLEKQGTILDVIYSQNVKYISNASKIKGFNKDYYYINFKIIIAQETFGTHVLWKSQNNIQMVQSNTFLQNNIKADLSNSQKTVNYVGVDQGQVSLTHYNKEITIEKVFNVQTYSDNDKISFIRYSFLLKYFYVITKYFIYEIDLFTNEFIGKLSLQYIFLSTESIQNLYLFEKVGILIAYTQKQVYIKDYVSKSSYRLQVNSEQYSILQDINGLFFDSSTKEVFIFGNMLVKTDLKFSSLKKISSSQDSQFQVCLFFDQLIICKHNSIRVSFYDRNQDYFVIQVLDLQSPYTLDFRIYSDTENQNIFFIQSNIDVYDFQGIFKVNFPQISQNVIQFDAVGTYLVAYTDTIAYIYQRSTLTLKTTFFSQGGVFVKGYYFQEVNILAYVTNEIRWGQIKLYSLETLSFIGSVSSVFPNNGVGIVLNLKFDPDAQEINYLDNYGNISSARFGQQIFMCANIALDDKEQDEFKDPINYTLDFSLNDIYFFNAKNAWKNYQRIFLVEKVQYLLIKQQQLPNQLIQDIQILYNNNNNFIFSYDKIKTIFVKKYDEEIQEMKNLYQDDKLISLIVFQNRILAYIGQSIDLKADAYDFEIKTYSLFKFLLTQSNIAIFQTLQNEIVDYNFKTNNKRFSFQLDQNTIIQSKISVLKDQNNWNLYFSLNNGSIVKYDIIKKSYEIYPPIQNQNNQIIKFTYLNKGSFLLSMKSGQLFEVNDRFQLLPEQVLNQKVQLITQQKIKLKEIQYIFVKYDPQRERLFFSVGDLKYVGVYDILNNYSFITYLYFPDLYWKEIYFTKKLILLSCSFQINIYSYDLQYIGRHRKSNRLFQIKNVIEVYDNIFLVLYLTGIETIVINNELNFVKSINMIYLNNFKLIHFQSILDLDLIIITGLSSTGIFNEKLSIKYILEQGQYFKQNTALQYTNNNQICTYNIEYIDYVLTSNEIDKIYRFQYNHNIFYQFTILINNEINLINIFNKSNVKIVIRPLNSQNSFLTIKESSFQNVPFNVYITDFNILLNDQEKRIYFHNNTQNIILQNIKITNQSFKQGTSIIFDNKNIIQIQNITISDIKFEDVSKTKRSSQSQNEKQAFLEFNGCNYVIIENLIISNFTQENQNFLLIKSTQQKQLILKNFVIENSYITDNLIFLSDIDNLKIEQTIIKDCQKYKKTIDSQQYTPFIYIEGIDQIRIENLMVKNNINIIILKSNDSYEDILKKYFLKKSQIQIKNSQLINNTFTLDQNKGNQINLIELKSETLYIVNLESTNNQANILIHDSINIIIYDSVFKDNSGVQGGALQLQFIESLIIDNSQFYNNNVTASGGSLSLLDVKDFQISSSCKFINNSALIGGAIRVQITDSILLDTLNIIIDQSIFFNNTAKIYGNNIGTYPTKFQIHQSKNESQTDKMLKYEGQIFQSSQNIITLDDIQSGSNIFLSIQLQEKNGNIIDVKQDKILENRYPQEIMDELQMYTFEIVNQNSQNDFEIKGESLITIRQYNSLSKSIGFNNLILGSTPNHSIKTSQMKVKITTWYPIIQIPLHINFRKCEIGEIPVYASSTITYCQMCQNGTYSIQDPQSFENSKVENDQISCKKCPSGAQTCEKEKIVLKQGYWRENVKTDLIIQCNDVIPEICDPENTDSRFGCQEGHIGPLCETCDIFGDVWDGNSYSEVFGDYTCSICSNSGIQIFYICFVMFIIILYLGLSIKVYINSFNYNVLCTYVRLLKLLPFSKSCIQDQSTFIIKSFINYLQLSSILVNTKINILPNIFSYLPTFFGQPSSKISVGLNCFFKDLGQLLNNQDTLQLTSIIYSFIPISIFILILLFFVAIITITKKLSYPYYPYLILNIVFFFFQPDTINYFTSSLVCRKIADKLVARNNLLLDCDDPILKIFSLYVTIPFLIFWISLPLAILIKFIIDKRKYNNLDYCTMKFKFGYFYLEFKEKYYYWEFIRVFFKISIVIIITLLNSLQLLQYILSLIIISLYLYIIIKLKPFQSIKLSQLEEVSMISLICNIFLSQFYIMIQSKIIGAILILSHYTILLNYLYVILHIKIQLVLQQPNSNTRWLFSKILPKNLFESIIIKTQHKLKTLLFWKKIFKNLAILRGMKVTEQIKKIEDSSQVNTSSVFLKEHRRSMKHKSQLIPNNSKRSKQYQNYQKFSLTRSQSKVENINSTLMSDDQLQCPNRSPVFILQLPMSYREEPQQVKLTEVLNSMRNEQDELNLETNKYCTDFDEVYSTQQVYSNVIRQKND